MGPSFAAADVAVGAMWVQTLFAVAALSGAAQAYFITVDAHAEECFFDKVEAGTKMGKYVPKPPP